jgi:hypothetical protein
MRDESQMDPRCGGLAAVFWRGGAPRAAGARRLLGAGARGGRLPASLEPARPTTPAWPLTKPAHLEPPPKPLHPQRGGGLQVRPQLHRPRRQHRLHGQRRGPRNGHHGHHQAARGEPRELPGRRRQRERGTGAGGGGRGRGGGGPGGLHAGSPANFLDAGGNASEEQVRAGGGWRGVRQWGAGWGCWALFWRACGARPNPTAPPPPAPSPRSSRPSRSSPATSRSRPSWSISSVRPPVPAAAANFAQPQVSFSTQGHRPLTRCCPSLLSPPPPRAGGIMKCDVIASGIVNAAKQARPRARRPRRARAPCCAAVPGPRASRRARLQCSPSRRRPRPPSPPSPSSPTPPPAPPPPPPGRHQRAARGAAGGHQRGGRQGDPQGKPAQDHRRGRPRRRGNKGGRDARGLSGGRGGGGGSAERAARRWASTRD